MAFSLDSSTADNVKRFLNETRLSEGMASSSPKAGEAPDAEQHAYSLDLASSPQLDVQVVAESESDIASQRNNNNKYKSMLRYKPNASFHGDVSPSNSASIPNTFKHKSHPNAKTKPHIGLPSLAETSSLAGNKSECSSPVKTSTLRNNAVNLDASNHHETSANDNSHTPSWMPSGLDDKWEMNANSDHHHSGAEQREKASLRSNLPLDFLNSNSNTLVHNPQVTHSAAVTPMWKRVSKDYQSRLVPSPAMHHIFSSTDRLNHTTDSSTQSPKAPTQEYASLSSLSTPIAVKDSDLHLTQQQIDQIEIMLEEAKDKPDDYQIKGSPLKLFGNEYDTFTKAILSKFVEKVRSNANSVQREPHHPTAQIPLPKLKIKTFTKSGEYTDKDFMQNANNIFANLQKKGYKSDNVFEKSFDQNLHHRSSSQNQTTATSTPKPEKIDKTIKDIDSLDEFSSYSTSFNEDVSSDVHSQLDEKNEYTEIERTYLRNKDSDYVSGDEMFDNNSYTFDEFSNTNSKTDEDQKSSIGDSRQSYSPQLRDESPSPGSNNDGKVLPMPLLESSMSSVKQFLKSDVKNPKESSLDRDSRSAFIKWKRPSQLRLLSSSSNKANLPSNSDLHVKGFLKAGNFPDQYGNMILDNRKQRWVSNEKENNYRDSLDSIEDLVTFSDDKSRSETKWSEFSSKKNVGANSKKKNYKKAEVSFADQSGFSSDRHAPDVTNVSDFGNVTFSESNKRLVSLITGSTDEVYWEKVRFIDLSDKNIDRVESLEQYLPAVKKIDLSRNKLKFVEGLPSTLYELEVRDNCLSDITSFQKFHDLQILNASFNLLQSLNGVSKNINLTMLNLSGNEIKSLNGLESLNALITLDLSRNELSGPLALENFELHNLKELNVSENSITSISGIENLENLRVLNVNENRIKSIHCAREHKRLKKLTCKYNCLSELDLISFPYLRVLRIDGNAFSSLNGLKKLGFLQELSGKCQKNDEIVGMICAAAIDVPTVDVSGNEAFPRLIDELKIEAFPNLNNLNLSAIGIVSLPRDFSQKFFNVRELNLNFNKLSDISGLSGLKQLRKVQMLSNNISSLEDILNNLQHSRKRLKCLDIRLNMINFNFYPYVFSPQELEYAEDTKGNGSVESPIPLHATEDIENFTIHYNTMIRGKEEWQQRDSYFLNKMRLEGKDKFFSARINYEKILIKFFTHLKELDGGIISHERRQALEDLTESQT